MKFQRGDVVYMAKDDDGRVGIVLDVQEDIVETCPVDGYRIGYNCLVLFGTEKLYVWHSWLGRA